MEKKKKKKAIVLIVLDMYIFIYEKNGIKWNKIYIYKF